MYFFEIFLFNCLTMFPAEAASSNEPMYSLCARSSNEQAVQEIDAKIEELKEMKRGYEARAIRAENQADRLQFEDQFMLEARRFYRIADENRQKAEKIQQEIDKLEAEKMRLLHGT